MEKELDPKNIDHKYPILKKIGGGGFSEVYLVDGPAGECALKLLKEVSTSGSQAALQEFKNEFSVLKNLNHPHIANILDFGFDEELGRYYYTSEMIKGSTLFDATEGKSVEQITDLIVQALRALEYLHSFHIYHFDIKSANVLVIPGDEPMVKLIDFGLAGIDPRGRLIGTPSYMSPEIVNREPADWRADIYSLGVLWYFCIARFNPFRAKQARETLQNQLRLEPPPPSTFNDKVPSWMDAIIARMLEKNPGKRYNRAARVMREINRFVAQRYALETRETLVSYLPQEGELIGRVEELELVRRALNELVEGTAKSKEVLVEGALGSGKTRLIREFKYEAQLAEIRVQLASATDADAYAHWCEGLSAHVSKGEDLEVFILDDVEALAADESTAQQFMALLTRARRPGGSASALVLMATAADAEGQFIESLRTVVPTKIGLENFSPEELTDYLASLTGLEEPPPALVKGIYSRTGGNPLFVTEVLKALITGGGLFDEGGRWRASVFEDVGVDYSKVQIPSTVEELLLNTVNTLGDDERKLLEALAVVNRPASGELLIQFTSIDDPFPSLRHLIETDLVDRSEDHRFSFRNELLGHALYTSLSIEQRAGYHDRIAHVLDEEGAPLEEVAHHMSFGSDAARSLKASIELGEDYLKRGLGRRAARYLERAAEMVPLDDVEQRVDVLLKHGEALLISRDYVGAEALFGQVEQLLPKLPATEQAELLRVESLIRLGGTYMKLLAFSRARAAFTEAKIMLHTKITDPVQEIHVENFLGGVLMSEGRYREAKELFRRTREAWRELDFDERRRATNNDLGMVALALGEVEAAREAFDEDLAFAEELGDDLLISRAHYNIAQLAMAERRLDDAIAAYKECVEVCKRCRNTELMLRAYNGLGNIFHVKGELDQSIVYYERGLALHERAGDARGGAAISVNIGIIESARGNFDAALDSLVPAIEFLKGMPDRTASDWSALSRGLLELGDVQRQRGEFDTAVRTLNQAYDIAVSHEAASKQRFWILSTLADIALDKEDDKRLKSLIAQMKPIATTEQEKQRLAEVAGHLSTDSASTSKAVKRSEESVSVSVAEQKRRRHHPSPYEKVLEINKLINAERELDYVLKTVVYYALELAGAESGAIILVDQEGEFTVASHRNMDGREDEVAFSRTLARRVLDEGKAVTTDNAQEDDRFAGEESIALHQLRSIMCLPVRAKGKVIGVLYLDHRFSPGAFKDVDMKVIDAFTDQVGLAIENARLVGMLSQRKDELSAELSAAAVRIEQYEEMLKERSMFEPVLDYGMLQTQSSAMRGMLKMLDKVSDTDLSVLLVGESGVGKELIARALHENHAARKSGRFVAINCGAVTATLMESELFGYKAGAFTGAHKDKKGFIEEAGGGTLFFDEIGELDPVLQVKLLRVLQEREFTPVGGTRPVPCDVRVVAATHRDIDAMVKEGTFREDLFYRLCQIKVVIPPLRDRSEDIRGLVHQFVQEAAGGAGLKVDPPLMKRLYEYPWPGNVRELKNVIEVMCALTEGDVITIESVPETSAFAQYFMDGGAQLSKVSTHAAKKDAPVCGPAKQGQVRIDDRNAYDPGRTWRAYEKIIVAKAYRDNGFHASRTAAALGVSTATMYKRVSEWNLKDKDNAIYDDPFVYTSGRVLDAYLSMVFRAAFQHAGGKAMQAIANLGVSQGHFYKIMKQFR